MIPYNLIETRVFSNNQSKSEVSEPFPDAEHERIDINKVVASANRMALNRNVISIIVPRRHGLDQFRGWSAGDGNGMRELSSNGITSRWNKPDSQA